MSEKLKPCPLCGGEAESYKDHDYRWVVECINKYCCCTTGYFPSKTEAITAWDARAKDEEIASLQEQLIKMCRVFHSIDCVCKWCNIAKERAVAGT